MDVFKTNAFVLVSKELLEDIAPNRGPRAASIPDADRWAKLWWTPRFRNDDGAPFMFHWVPWIIGPPWEWWDRPIGPSTYHLLPGDTAIPALCMRMRSVRTEVRRRFHLVVRGLRGLDETLT